MRLRPQRRWELARPATFDILRDRRLGLVACAAVDTAIWDAVGKSLGEPLWRLWGGYRDRVPMISIGGYYGHDLDAEVESPARPGSASPRHEAQGRRCEPRAPTLSGSRASARSQASRVLPRGRREPGIHRPGRDRVRPPGRTASNIDWFEEPCRWHNGPTLAMRDVRLMAGVRVTAGQSEHSAPVAAATLMVEGAIDICNFDASWSGGPTEWRRVAAVAAHARRRMGHHEEPHVATHLLASIAHGIVAECFDPTGSDRWNLVANRPRLDDGKLRLPDAPGLGWELDRDYMEAPVSGRRARPVLWTESSQRWRAHDDSGCAGDAARYVQPDAAHPAYRGTNAGAARRRHRRLVPSIARTGGDRGRHRIRPRRERPGCCYLSRASLGSRVWHPSCRARCRSGRSREWSERRSRRLRLPELTSPSFLRRELDRRGRRSDRRRTGARLADSG